MKKIIFCIVLISNALGLKSQTVSQQAYWFRLLGKVKITDKLFFQLETDYRRLTNPDRLWQNYNQMRLHYHFHHNWETVAGLGYARVWSGALPVPEWRPYQSVQYFQPLGKDWQLAYRYQVEERVIHHANKTELTEGYDFKLRSRGRIQITKVFNKNWTVRLSEELYYQLNESFNQTQTWFIIEKQFKNGFALDLGYQKAYIRRASGYINRDNIRFTVIKNMAFNS